MLYKVTIKDSSNTPLSYLPEIPALKTGSVFNFKPGVNVIVGPNGSGKTTLLRLITMFTFTEDYNVSTVPDVIGSGERILEFPKIFSNIGDDVKDGAKIEMDYKGVVFRYLPGNDMKVGVESRSFKNIGTWFTSKHSSTGETTMQGLTSLFNEMFSRTDYNFPIAEIEKIRDIGNSVWTPRMESLLQYYKDNQVKCAPSDFEYTVLMDEPDKNLDIDNTKQVYGILSQRKEQTQLVAVVHNPAIIYKLSKLDHVNFIEMEPGYVDKVRAFMEESHK